MERKEFLKEMDWIFNIKLGMEKKAKKNVECNSKINCNISYDFGNISFHLFTNGSLNIVTKNIVEILFLNEISGFTWQLGTYNKIKLFFRFYSNKRPLDIII